MDDSYFSSSSDRMAPSDSILLDYTTKDIPTNIKELFQLVEYLAFNSGQVVSAMKKLTEFPITRPSFDTDNASLKKTHEAFAKEAKYKSVALNVGFDYNMYGNSITSVYLPFQRYLICPNCNKKTLLKHCKFHYEPGSDVFHLEYCPHCNSSGPAEVEDRKLKDISKVNIIRWDLKQIDIEYNSFSGKSSYYYNLAEQERQKIKDNNLDILSTYPRPLLGLAGKDKNFRFKFSDDYVFHMKTPCLCGISKVWGYPPPTPALKSFFYQFMLRKANEAVALDHLNQLRVIYPEMSQPGNNPLQYINMSVWADEMSSTVKKWRQDKNFIKLSPHPMGYQELGGGGRGLLLTNEIREASYDILLTLGIPRDLMEGSTAQSMASPVLLRIVENMMLTYMEQMNDWLNWVDNKISSWHGTEEVESKFIPFKFIDDLQRQQLLMNWGQGGQSKKVSDTTIADHLEVDLEEEEKKIVEDSIRDYRLQKTVTQEIQKLEKSLTEQAIQESAMSEGQMVDYNNPQQTIGQADQIAMQLAQIPYEERKSQLSSLQKEDFVLYSVVIQRLEAINREMKQSVNSAAKMASERQYPEDLFKGQD